MKKEVLIKRNKEFVLGVVKYVDALLNAYSPQVFGRQVIRCASSVGANYRTSCRAKSQADFINKLRIVEEEADESIYFLDWLISIFEKNKVQAENLINEADQLLAIYVASIKTMKAKVASPKIEISKS
jgi:four helix bundle protein